MTQPSPSSSLDWEEFNDWFYDEYLDPSCPQMVLESRVELAPADDDSPEVLAPGATAIVHAGAGLYHGGAPGGPEGTHAQQTELNTGNNPRVALRYSYRNTSLTLTGPLTAAKLLELLTRRVAVECGRNSILEEALRDNPHAEWAQRYLSPKQGAWELNAPPLDGPPVEGLSEEQLLEDADEVLGGGGTTFDGFMEGKDGVVATCSAPFG